MKNVAYDKATLVYSNKISEFQKKKKNKLYCSTCPKILNTIEGGSEAESERVKLPGALIRVGIW